MSRRSHESAAVVAMVAATALWGGTFVAIRDSVKTMTPVALVCARFTVAALVFGAIALLRRRAPGGREWFVGAGNGLIMVGSFTLQALGLRTTSAGSSAFLTCAGTLFAAFYAWPLLKERPSRSVVLGIALALAGSALMSLDGALRLGTGEVITLLGATLYALQIVWVARHAREVDTLSLAFAQAATVAVVLVPFAGDPRAAFGALTPSGWAQFAYLALAGSAVAPCLQLWAQRELPPGRIGLLFALEPVFALVIALTLGGERFEPRWWAGAALILVAVVAVEWHAARQPGEPKPAAA